MTLSDLMPPLPGLLDPATPVDVRAMAANLLADHRIPPDRLSRLADLAGVLDQAHAIRDSLRRYQTAEVRPLKTSDVKPAYLRGDNTSNRVDPPPRTFVATLLDLTRLGHIYADAAARRVPAFRRFAVTDPRDHTQVNDFIGPRLSDPAQRRTFLGAILRARSYYRKSRDERIHPTWVAEWSSLEPYLDPDRPEEWLRAVGVPREHQIWLAVFKYRASRTQLFRPTQLDAGWYAHHFPSPPQHPPPGGGLSMYLSSSTAPAAAGPGLVEEYLHQEIDYRIQDWVAGGQRLRLAGPTGGDLADQRTTHWRLLQDRFGEASIRAWMNKPI
jgi:hypothetical protein